MSRGLKKNSQQSLGLFVLFHAQEMVYVIFYCGHNGVQSGGMFSRNTQRICFPTFLQYFPSMSTCRTEEQPSEPSAGAKLAIIFNFVFISSNFQQQPKLYIFRKVLFAGEKMFSRNQLYNTNISN